MVMGWRRVLGVVGKGNPNQKRVRITFVLLRRWRNQWGPSFNTGPFKNLCHPLLLLRLLLPLLLRYFVTKHYPKAKAVIRGGNSGFWTGFMSACIGFGFYRAMPKKLELKMGLNLCLSPLFFRLFLGRTWGFGLCFSDDPLRDRAFTGSGFVGSGQKYLN